MMTVMLMINFHLKTVKHHAPMFTMLNIYSVLIVQKRHIFKGSSCNFSSVNCTPAAKCSSESFIADARSETLNCRLLRTVHWSNEIFCLCLFPQHEITLFCTKSTTPSICSSSVYVNIFTYSNYGVIILFNQNVLYWHKKTTDYNVKLNLTMNIFSVFSR